MLMYERNQINFTFVQSLPVEKITSLIISTLVHFLYLSVDLREDRANHNVEKKINICSSKVRSPNRVCKGNSF